MPTTPGQLAKFAQGGNVTDSVITETNGGLIGVGTATPTAKVEIRVANEGDWALKLQSGPNDFLDIRPTHAGGRYQTELNTLNNRDLLILPGTGNVGIGTSSPSVRTQIGGSNDQGATLAIMRSDNNKFVRLGVGTEGVALDFDPTSFLVIQKNTLGLGGVLAGQELLRITADGNVGIGTTGPSARLTVEGLAPNAGGPPDAAGVIGQVVNLGQGFGRQSAGVRGINDEGHGVQGQSDSHVGVEGTSNSGTALFAQSDSGVGVWAVTTSGPFAGLFTGPVHVAGTLSKSGGGFRIDHPSDPANKYLNHSFVESPEMKNLYDGVAILDDRGEATVTLPDWFEALNEGFRYQLTPIGAPAPQLHVADEIEQGRFRIAGGAPGRRVSWQVTGVRKDQWARAHPLAVEEAKRDEERGYYLHPELFGQEEDGDVMAARFPGMRRKRI